jgi:hypothetical protein
MRQINPMIERTPEGFDAQVNAVIQEIGSEHLREIRTMKSTPTEPDRLYGAFIAILIYDLLETGQEEV